MNAIELLSIALFATFAFFSTATLNAQNFDGVEWIPDKSNKPEQDKSGKGKTPSTKNATNNQGTYKFEITTSGDGTQRQEWKFERRKDYTQMSVKFRINSEQKDFNEVAIAQCHDDQEGPEGVFSIYQIRRSEDKYYFGVQGDTTEAHNYYSKFEPVEVELDEWYGLQIQTYTKGKVASFERARLWILGGNKIWDNTISGGGDEESYYKIGAYRLGGGFGKVSVSFEDLKLFKGRKPKPKSKK